ncbi:helix-hairpin-helix domain-containing protein [bacterium RCC_150]
MPRRNGAAPVDDAASAARRRFVARLAPASEDLAATHPGQGSRTERSGRHSSSGDSSSGHLSNGHSRSEHSHSAAPLLPLQELMEPGSGAGFEERSGPPRLRWRAPWRVAVMLAIPCLGLMLWFAWQSWAKQPTVEPLARSSSEGKSSGAGRTHGANSRDPSTQQDAGELLTVHVAGAVKNPGIVQVPVGARIFDAIQAAGGTDSGAQLESLNLAALVEDAAKIQVPRAGEALAAPSGASGNAAAGSGAAGAGKINLNTATAEELDALPKVGPVLAKRIVEWRQQHGPFATVEDLDAVDGVGPKMLESLIPLVTV